MYAVYVLEHQTTRRSYVGISTDPSRRVRQHNGEITGGARSTRSQGPGWIIAEATPCIYDRSTALRIERRVKRARGKERRCAALHQNQLLVHHDRIEEGRDEDIGDREIT